MTEAPRVSVGCERPRLLVIDDEPLIGRLVARLLRHSHDVVAVSDANDGLSLALNEDWDVILCDIRMPGLDGLTLSRRLRATRPEAARVLGFATGGGLDAPTRARLVDSELGCLDKPFTRRSLFEFLERIRTHGDAA